MPEWLGFNANTGQRKTKIALQFWAESVMTIEWIGNWWNMGARAHLALWARERQCCKDRFTIRLAGPFSVECDKWLAASNLSYSL